MTLRSDRHLEELRRAIAEGSPERPFGHLHAGLADLVGFRVLTVLKIDPATLRSVRLYSSEPSYPAGGTKQHVRSLWSEAIYDRREPFLAPDLAAVRATFPDSAGIEAAGCGAVLALPIIEGDAVLGTVNLWDREGHYDTGMAEAALPFATALAPLCAA